MNRRTNPNLNHQSKSHTRIQTAHHIKHKVSKYIKDKKGHKERDLESNKIDFYGNPRQAKDEQHVKSSHNDK
jgi:hypothetical protein